MAQALSARAINQQEKMRIRNFTVGTEKMRLVLDVYNISVVISRAGKETSWSQAEGSTATKTAPLKSENK